MKASGNENTKGQKLCMGRQECTLSYTQQSQKTVSGSWFRASAMTTTNKNQPDAQ
jgi:hypothetical protein